MQLREQLFKSFFTPAQTLKEARAAKNIERSHLKFFVRNGMKGRDRKKERKAKRNKVR